MSRTRMHALLARDRRHLCPFLVLGDPDPETSVELCARAVRAGATMLELGLPYSDPVADGPEVARAGERALAAGVDVGVALDTLGRVRARTDVPLHLLVYGNLVHARGPERFAAEAAGAGASSLLVPDVPLEEGRAIDAACRAAGLGRVQLAAPTSPRGRWAELGAACDGFLYLVSQAGVTGARDTLPASSRELVRAVAAAVDAPVAVGFGLSRAEHCRAVFDAGARIAIVGSALLRVVREHVDAPRDTLLRSFERACHQLAGALPRPTPSPCS